MKHRFTVNRVGEVLAAVLIGAYEAAGAVVDLLADLYIGRRCPICDRRSAHLPAHISIDHAGGN